MEMIFLTSLIATILAAASKRFRLPFGVIAVLGFGLIAYLESQPDGPSTTSEAAAAKRVQEEDQGERVTISFTSDPGGARVFVAEERVGTTPHTLEHAAGQPLEYTIRADEPYDAYNLYEPYSDRIAPTEDASVDVWLERTTEEEQQEQRELYAERQAAVERRRLMEAVRESPWRFYERTDPINDADTSYITVDATDYPTSLEDDAYMTIRCDEEDPTASDGIALFINADDYLGSGDLELDWRFDDNAPVRRQRWRASTEGDAVFNLSYKTHFLAQMVDAERLTVRLYDYRGTSLEYAFDVESARAALNRLGCYRGGAL